jgi:diaminopimelate epimerase
MKLPFTKMHSLGNDFIVINTRDINLKKLSLLAKNLCDRRFGIGADQLLLLCDSQKADFKMRILNADGSEVEMCGNGIRCLGKFIWDKKIKNQKSKVRKNTTQQLSIETLGGIKHIRKIRELIEVDMGEPILEPEKIPVSFKAEGRRQKLTQKAQNSKLLINYPLQVKDKTFKITCVSMGNPHAVIVVKDVRSIPVSHYGPMIENHRLFPKRTNVEFVQILNRNNIKMRVWERGAGETMACGTGFCFSRCICPSKSD